VSHRFKDDHLCDNCGEPGATHARHQRDVTPTDRGDWVQEYVVYYCDDCNQEYPEEE
jgi:hypothetical protein